MIMNNSTNGTACLYLNPHLSFDANYTVIKKCVDISDAYFNIKTDELFYFTNNYTIEDLREFIDGVANGRIQHVVGIIDASKYELDDTDSIQAVVDMLINHGYIKDENVLYLPHYLIKDSAKNEAIGFIK